MSGIGNVYRAELLWRAGIDPHTPGSSIDAETLAALWDDAGDLLAVGLGLEAADEVHLGATAGARSPRCARFGRSA